MIHRRLVAGPSYPYLAATAVLQGAQEIKTMTNSVRPLFSVDVKTAKQQAYLFRDLLKYHCKIDLPKSQALDCFAQTFHQENWASLTATLRTEAKDWVYYAYPGYLSSNYGNSLRSSLQAYGHNVDHCVHRVILDMPLEAYISTRTPEGAAICTILNGSATWTIPNLLAQYKSQGSCDDFVLYTTSSNQSHIPVRFSSDPLTGKERIVAFNIDTEKEVFLNPVDVRFMPNALTVDLNDTSSVKHSHSLPYAIAKHWMMSGGTVLITSGEDNYTETFDGDIDAALQHIEQKNPGKKLYFFAINIDVHHPVERWERSFKESRLMLPLLEMASKKFNASLNALLNDDSQTSNSIDSEMKMLFRDYNEIAKLSILAFWEDTKEINSKSSLLMSYCNDSKFEREQYISPKDFEKLIG